jgi:integrase/recombinase XerD
MKNLSKNYQEILEEVALYLQAVGYQKGSQQGIKGGVKAFLFWLESKSIYQLQAIRRSTIKDYQEYLENRPNKVFKGGLSSKMIRDYLWSVSLLLKLQEQQNRLDKNPMSGYVLPKVESEKRAILTLLEITRLYEACSSLKERCILHVYYGLGLRRSEGEALNLKDIDYKNGWLFVRKGKGGKTRNIPLTAAIQSDLKDYVLNHRPRVHETALFLNTLHKRYRGASALKLVKKLIEKANIDKKIDLHCLRHSITTHLIQQGMPIEQVRDYLGHAHLESTQNYIHYDTKKLFKEQVHGFNREEL